MSVFSIFNWFKSSSKSFGLTDHDALSSSENASGECVNTDSALTLSAVWACVKLISESIASLPCGVFTRDAEGDKVPAENNELYFILRESPNADMSAFDFWQCVIASLLLRGNSFSLKHYRGAGTARKLIALEPLHPDYLSIKCNDNGTYTYYYYDEHGKKYEYSEEQIFHIKSFSLNGKLGLSTIGFARQSIGSALAQEKTTARLASAGMRRGGAVTVDKFLSEDQREKIRTNVIDKVTNVAKTSGVIILEGGMKYESLSLTPEDAQMIESRSFSVEDVCRWFNVPPAMIGHTQKATTWGTGLEQMNLGFLTYTLTPIIKRIEQEIKRSLIPAVDKKNLFAEFNIEGFLRADSAGRAALYSSFTQNGIMTRAEVRRKENLPYKEGSDELTVQSAQINLDDLQKLNSVAPKPILE